MKREVNFKKTGFKSVVCTAIFSLLLSFSFAQKEVDFRINLDEGDCFEVQTTTFSKTALLLKCISYNIPKKVYLCIFNKNSTLK